ncbi:hypothetical protein KBTX_01393 [wastewater metagenome]|uniref:Phospholipid/glycerol acyltransferase domain-containing protein n=2 Tax=unclassified sequences TaxID=12908 RepID=A0A5B8RC76_9ZZZZ|nr:MULTISPECIES: lysophospholipid acyltransferase family protein [Arhodomonas]MCS4504964.1 1-acyl-sn-glycerol-3-phosphate acyltransferase [Arhodomonas aquaeolei]QEA05074.1 hypothetical protein KBTEX_01393 [uncultured organism]
MTDQTATPRLLQGIIFRSGVVISVVLWGLLSLFTAVLPFRWRYWFISRWCWWLRVWLRISAGITEEIEGRENIPSEPGVVMAKHQSAWETVALVRLFYPQTWVVKRELLWLPVFGWAFGLLRPIGIDRGAGRDAVRQVVRKGSARLADGQWVIVYPEGTRVPAGHKARYRAGGAILACETGSTITPVAHNAGEHWPRDGWHIRPGVVRLRIGPPIETAGRKPDEVMTEVEAWIERETAALSALGYPGTPFERRTKRRG